MKHKRNRIYQHGDKLPSGCLVLDYCHGVILGMGDGYHKRYFTCRIDPDDNIFDSRYFHTMGAAVRNWCIRAFPGRQLKVIDKKSLKAAIRCFDKCCTTHKLMLNAGNASVIAAHDRIAPRFY